MEEIFIFKYKDTVDGRYAFIIHENEEKARKILEQETSLDFVLCGSKFLEEVPEAYKHWFSTFNYIYINEILPF